MKLESSKNNNKILDGYKLGSSTNNKRDIELECSENNKRAMKLESSKNTRRALEIIIKY